MLGNEGEFSSANNHAKEEEEIRDLEEWEKANMEGTRLGASKVEG
jgi:hypothetical protein